MLSATPSKRGDREVERLVAAMNVVAMESDEDGEQPLDERVDAEAVAQILERIERVAPGLSPERLQTLWDALSALEERCRAHGADLQAELARVDSGRTAVRGYSHLRSFQSGQRLYRRA